MPQRKVRFLIKVDGRVREIFSVKELKNGNLTVAPRTFVHSFNEVPGANAKRPVGKRYISIHRSELSKSKATTIKSTMVINGGETQTHVALIRDSKENLLWPVCSFLTADVRFKLYDQGEFDASKKVFLGNSNPDTSTLIYHIIVSAPNIDLPDVGMCQLYVERFQYFNLAVYTCHLNLPASPFGSGIHRPTRVPQLDGVELPSVDDFTAEYPYGADALASADMFDTIADLTTDLVRNYYQFWLKNVPGSEVVLAMRAPMISALPHPAR